jgi:hypothetical protein
MALLAVVLFVWTMFLTTPVRADGCDPKNLLKNCSFEEGWHQGTNGDVPDGWVDFQVQGRPRYEISDFEKMDGAKGLRIWNSSTPFKAGIYQQVQNVLPGTWYQAIIRWAPIKVTMPGGQFPTEGDLIGRKVGIDPTGGTDPTSPNIAWSPEDWKWDLKHYPVNGLSVSVPAQATTITVFVYAEVEYAHMADEVFIDWVELVPDTSKPTATPVPPTATPTMTPKPTAPPPTAAPAPPTAVPATPVPPTAIPTETATPLPTRTPRPEATPTPKPEFDLPVSSDELLIIATAAFGVGVIFGLVALVAWKGWV